MRTWRHKERESECSTRAPGLAPTWRYPKESRVARLSLLSCGLGFVGLGLELLSVLELG